VTEELPRQPTLAKRKNFHRPKLGSSGEVLMVGGERQAADASVYSTKSPNAGMSAAIPDFHAANGPIV
jgi:hypothetical protein